MPNVSGLALDSPILPPIRNLPSYSPIRPVTPVAPRPSTSNLLRHGYLPPVMSNVIIRPGTPISTVAPSHGILRLSSPPRFILSPVAPSHGILRISSPRGFIITSTPSASANGILRAAAPAAHSKYYFYDYSPKHPLKSPLHTGPQLAGFGPARHRTPQVIHNTSQNHQAMQMSPLPLEQIATQSKFQKIILC